MPLIINLILKYGKWMTWIEREIFTKIELKAHFGSPRPANLWKLSWQYRDTIIFKKKTTILVTDHYYPT